MHSGDEDEAEALQALQISDAKEIFFLTTRKRITISSTILNTDENGTFIKLIPHRHAQVAYLIVSRCSPHMQAQARKEGKTFWTSKTKRGWKFLDKLRRLHRDAMKLKFDVASRARLTSRAKKQRCKQLVTDVMHVALPTIGEFAGKFVTVKKDIDAMRKNGRAPMWIRLDPEALDHLSRVARAWIEDDNEDEGPEDNNEGSEGIEIEGSENKDEDVGSTKDDNVSSGDDKGSTKDEHEGFGDYDMNVDSPLDSSTAASSPPSASASASYCYKKSPLFQAFKRGSEKP